VKVDQRFVQAVQGLEATLLPDNAELQPPDLQCEPSSTRISPTLLPGLLVKAARCRARADMAEQASRAKISPRRG